MRAGIPALRSVGERLRPIEAMHDEDDRPRKPAAHEIGQALDTLSLGDLAERIALLKAEIARLEAAMNAREAARKAAGSVFGS